MNINAQFFLHHKTRKLGKVLGNDGIVSLIRLWNYAEEFRKNGVLVNMNESDIELVSEWQGEQALFVGTLLQIGFLDKNDGTFILHDFVTPVETPPVVTPLAPTGHPSMEKPSDLPDSPCSSAVCLPLGGGLSESPDYSVVVEERDECDEDKEYARLIRNGCEITPVDLFGTGKSQDELLRENLGKRYGSYVKMREKINGSG